MAHHIKIEEVAHQNKDGSPSTTKKDYRIVDRTRGKRIVVAVVASKAKVQPMIDEYRRGLEIKHMA